MQRDTMAGMDLTADPRQQDPSPGAKVVRLARRRLATGRLDLAEHEEPSTAGELAVDRVTIPEVSTLSAEVRIWKAFQARIRYEVRGPAASMASLCVATLSIAVLAAVAVPALVLPDAAPLATRLVAASVSAVAVLATGALAIHSLRKRY